MKMLKSFVAGYLLHAIFTFGAIGTIIWMLAIMSDNVWWLATPAVATYWFFWGRAFLRYEHPPDDKPGSKE